MRFRHWMRSLALIAVLGLVAAACSSGGTTTTSAAQTTTTAAATTTTGGATTTAAGGAVEGGPLKIGTLLPETGDLAFLGPPEIAGARLAVQDINDAGGVLGQPVTLIEGDSGDTKTDLANQTVDRELAQGVQAIIGAASSAVSKTVIDKIVNAGVIQFSPANTSPDFTTYNDKGLYFRTAPSDLLQGQVLADQIAKQGNQVACVIYRQESYGTGLANAFKDNFTKAGGQVAAFIAYSPSTTNFDAEVQQLVDANCDAVLVVGFDESATILETMHKRGIGPTDGMNVWGVDGNIGGIGGQLADPSIIVGMKGTEPSVNLKSIQSFLDRMDTAVQGGVGGVYAYGAETYDAIVITALAADVANSFTATDIAAQINGVTKDGTKCTSYKECAGLIAQGTNIDYDGLGGPYEFTAAGEPAAASYRISTYDGTYDPDGASGPKKPGSVPNPALDQYVFAGG